MDADPDVRRIAAEIAGVLKNKGLEPVLAMGMQDPITEVRIAAVQAAGESRQPTLRKDVSRLITSDVTEVRREALVSLYRFPADERDTARLVKLLDNERNPGVRVAALAMLMRISSASAMPILETELRNATGTRKLEFLKLLGLTDDVVAKDRLLAFLDDHADAEAQMTAAVALKRHGKDTEVYLALLDVLKDRDRALEVRRVVLSMLVDMKKVAGSDLLFPQLAQVLKTKSDPLKGEVIRALGTMEESRSADLIASILEDTEESPFIRNSAFVALTSLDPEFIVMSFESFNTVAELEAEKTLPRHSDTAQTFANDRFALVSGDCSLPGNNQIQDRIGEHRFNRQSQNGPSRGENPDHSCSSSGEPDGVTNYLSRNPSNFRIRVQSN